jgi:hypothetical protein
MERGYVNVHIGFTPDQSCFLDAKTKDFKPGGSPAEGLFHELVHAFRFVSPLLLPGSVSAPWTRRTF